MFILIVLLAAGMIDVLPKPFTKEGLLSMLQKHLSKLVSSNSEAGDAPGDAFDSTPQVIFADPSHQQISR